MASWWSITVPPQFQDITAESVKNPAFQASLENIRAKGGEASARFWASDTTGVLALDSTFAGMPNSLAVLDGFENGARRTSYGTGKEHSYTADKDGHFIVGHQHATSSDGVEMWLQRWTGRGTDGALHSLGVVCNGDEAACKAVLASVKLERKEFVLLSDIPASSEGASGTIAEKAGYITGLAMMGGFLVYALWKARQRSRAA